MLVKSGWPRTTASASDADRAAGIVEKLVGRLGQIAGEILENQDALVDRRGPDAIAVRYKQHVARIGDTAYSADQILTGSLVRLCKCRLADYETGGLPGGEVCRGCRCDSE